MATDGQDGNPEPWQALYTAALQELSVDELPSAFEPQRKKLRMN
jgi:hypothetical protein